MTPKPFTEATDFSNAARIFSKGKTAADGGALGWIDTTTLPPVVATALTGLKTGDITAPVVLQGADYSLAATASQFTSFSRKFDR